MAIRESTIIDAMADTLWLDALRRAGHRGKPRFPAVAKRAANDLATLYVEGNFVKHMKELLAHAQALGSSMDEVAFGRAAAFAALGESEFLVGGGKWLANKTYGIKAPKFTIDYDGQALAWDGSLQPGKPHPDLLTKYAPSENPRFGKDDEVIAVTLDKEANAKTIAAEIRKRWKKAHASVQAKNGMFSVVLTNLLWDDDDDRELAVEIRYWATDRASELEGRAKRNPYIHNPNEWPKSEVQSLLFETSEYSIEQAKAWAKEHGYHYGKVDTTGRFHRLRQEAPQGGPCRTIPFTKGISAIVCSAGRGKPPGVG